MSQNYLNIDRFIYGGDYNPEQWLVLQRILFDAIICRIRKIKISHF